MPHSLHYTMSCQSYVSGNIQEQWIDPSGRVLHILARRQDNGNYLKRNNTQGRNVQPAVGAFPSTSKRERSIVDSLCCSLKCSERKDSTKLETSAELIANAKVPKMSGGLSGGKQSNKRHERFVVRALHNCARICSSSVGIAVWSRLAQASLRDVARTRKCHVSPHLVE